MKKSVSNYYVDEEIETFEYFDVEEAILFMEDLPEMTAFELMLVMKRIKIEKIQWGDEGDIKQTD